MYHYGIFTLYFISRSFVVRKKNAGDCQQSYLSLHMEKLKNLHFLHYYMYLPYHLLCMNIVFNWIKHLKISLDNLGVKKVLAPSKCSLKWLKK